jgi:hypothetical protein
MRVLIDSQGLQAQVHQEDGKRLGVFISTLAQIASCSADFSTGLPLTGKELNDCDVLVVTTRYPRENAFSQAERTAVRCFVCDGGGLLLMSNHGDLPGSNPHDMTQYDAILARQYGVDLECTWFQNPIIGKLWSFSGSSLLAGHPILAGSQKEKAVQTIVTNNCSSIVAGGRGHALVALPPKMRDLRNGRSPSNRLFAHALDAETDASLVGKGRVVTVADSGFIGNEDTVVPGPGLIGHGDNSRFIKNVIRWLGRELG